MVEVTDALMAAALAVRDVRNKYDETWDDTWDEVAEAVLEAVKPHLASAERERIVALSREVQATYWVGPDDSLAPRRPFFFLIRESSADWADPETASDPA